MTKVSPSVLSADFACLGESCRRVLDAGADMIHFDVMDGHFVDNISFGLPVLESLKRVMPDAVYDVHLMITHPLAYCRQFAEAGADYITFHVETVDDIQDTIDAIRAAGCGAGLCVKPGTPVETVFPWLDQLEGRAVLVRRARPLPVECIVRGYISGSGWKSYQADGTICGHTLPAGLKESDKLEAPIFTPSTKAQFGQHDENISRECAAVLLGDSIAQDVEEKTLAIYKRGSEYAASRGIIVADTKLEFGFIDGTLHLIDEVLTPDSSRFWPAESYEPGHSQPSFDKQYLRDWLKSQPWDMQPPAPTLPDEVVEATAAKYQEAYRILTGKELGIN